jgi:hypothetical protein
VEKDCLIQLKTGANCARINKKQDNRNEEIKKYTNVGWLKQEGRVAQTTLITLFDTNEINVQTPTAAAVVVIIQ